MITGNAATGYTLYSRSVNPKTGKHRVLGRSETMEGIKKRERQVQFFKHKSADYPNQALYQGAMTLVKKAYADVGMEKDAVAMIPMPMGPGFPVTTGRGKKSPAFLRKLNQNILRGQIYGGESLFRALQPGRLVTTGIPSAVIGSLVAGPGKRLKGALYGGLAGQATSALTAPLGPVSSILAPGAALGTGLYLRKKEREKQEKEKRLLARERRRMAPASYTF